MIYSPTDLYLEPSQIPTVYARAARRLGVTMLPHTLVTGIATRDDAVIGVETEHGTIRCETVVDAAGAWLRAVAALSGANVAVVPTRHQLLITEPIAGVEAMQPITRIIDANVYVRPDEGGLMLGGYEQTPLQYDPRALPARFDIADVPLDLGVLRGFADAVREQLPVFQRVPEEIKLRVHRGGLPTLTADGEHTVGPVPGVRGLYVAGGCCVGGLSIAPAIGEASGRLDHRRRVADGFVGAGARARRRDRRGDAEGRLPVALRASLLAAHAAVMSPPGAAPHRRPAVSRARGHARSPRRSDAR